jgi:tetratricopeptide (TPR) repeat protein
MVEFRVSSLSYEEQLALYLEAEQLFNADRYAEAEPVLAAFARELPCFEHGMVWYQLADIFEWKGEFENADKAYLSALDCEWNEIYAIGYGTFLWRVGRRGIALAFLREFKRRVDAGEVLAPPIPQTVGSIIDAIEKQVPHEAYWSEH